MSHEATLEKPGVAVYSLDKTPEPAAELILKHLPDVDAHRIVIKPNWVRHQENRLFPIAAMVTSTDLIDAAVTACLEKYPRAQTITVADAPLRSCNWKNLAAQAGLDQLITKYASFSQPRIQFLDLRRERVAVAGGMVRKLEDDSPGDPLGYRQVLLDKNSFLDPICDQRDQFRISDLNHHETISSHAPGQHRYLISESVLAADLIVNMPKMKTHQKAGITGALKNLVGINAEKSCLVHFRRGTPHSGGDEFPPDVLPAVWTQVRLREYLLKHSASVFAVSQKMWQLLRKACRIQVEGTPENLGGRFYLAGGSWYGNDTIWRMVYDVNTLIRYAPKQAGALASRPQRAYVAILDGVIAGEGNGPLQPLPVNLGVLMFSEDPFLLDSVMARLMGFDYKKIPLLAHHADFHDAAWGRSDPEAIRIVSDGVIYQGVSSLPPLHHFLPPPGWKNHIELLAS